MEKSQQSPLQWVARSLERKLVAGIVTSLLLTSLVFLFLFIWLYQTELEKSLSRASLEVNHLLQASLENAMLKRDLAGLRGIVNQLGHQQDIVSTMILNPQGEVRFSSRPDRLGSHMPVAQSMLRSEYIDQATFTQDQDGNDVLRSFNPVPNKPVCGKCHGAVADNPVNGILLVDYQARPIRKQAQNIALIFFCSGLIVILITLFSSVWFMHRIVLRPVKRLTLANEAVTSGRLDTRVDLPGTDQLARLGHSFNQMTSSLQSSLREIEEKENFAQALIDADPDGIRVIDNDFNVLCANRAYRDAHCLEAIGGIHAKCYFSHARDQPCPPTLVTCPVHELREKSGPIKTVHRHVTENGNEIWLEIYAAQMTVESNGRQRKLIVESQRDMEKTAEYSREQKLSTVGQLAAGVAHEIHNPLASVRLALQYVSRSIDDQEQINTAQLYEYLQLVDKQVDRCIAVTGRLLKLSAFPDEKPTVIDVNKAIEETMSLLKYEAEGRHIDLNIQLDPSRPRMVAVDGDLRMITLNLAQNAFNAMPDGGRLIVRTRLVEDRIFITFDDTGAGIGAKQWSYMYDPFYSHRADGSKGTGLGLSIVKSLLSRYDGNIEASNLPSGGARFRVDFLNAESMLAESEK